MSDTTSLGAWVTDEGTGTWSLSQSAIIGPTNVPVYLSGQTQHPVQVRVAEQTAWVDRGPHRKHLVEPGVTRYQLTGVQGVQLAPVRTAAVAEQDVLDGQEILGEGLAVVAMDRDVGRRPSGRRWTARRRRPRPPGSPAGTKCASPCGRSWPLMSSIACGRASRSMAYSISRNRTRRGEVKTACEWSVNFRTLTSFAAAAFTVGNHLGHQPTGPAGQREDPVGGDFVVEDGTPARQADAAGSRPAADDST